MLQTVFTWCGVIVERAPAHARVHLQTERQCRWKTEYIVRMYLARHIGAEFDELNKH